jgi:hypothetical protein
VNPKHKAFLEGQPHHHALFAQMHAEALAHGFKDEGELHKIGVGFLHMKHHCGHTLILHRGFANWALREPTHPKARNRIEDRAKHAYGTTLAELQATLAGWGHKK